MDEPFEQPVNDRLIELAEIETGYTVVDVATGIGDPALSAARRVGPAGRVIATDQSTAMLAVAASRARDAGLTNIEFRQLDANVFDFPDATIDAIVCRWGLMFLSDLTDALGRMRRSLKPGRCLAAATWAEPDKVPIISVRRSVMRAFEYLQEQRSVSAFVSRGSESSAVSAGFDEVDVSRSVVPYEYVSAQAFVDAQRALHESRLTTPPRATSRGAGGILAHFGAAAQPYTGADGVVRMPSEILLLAARTR